MRLPAFPFLPVAALLPALTGGCIQASQPSQGFAKPSAPTMVFPSPSELAPLPSLPAPPEAFEHDALAVDRWSLDAQAQDERAPYQDPTAWGDFARELARSHENTLRLSPALRCAALEMARFYAEKGAPPTESLRRFLVARCGGAWPATVPFIYALRGGATTATEGMLFDRSKPSLKTFVDRHTTASAPQALAIATGHSKDRFVVVAILGPDAVALEPLTRSIDASRRVVVRGTLHDAAADVYALINRGEVGVERCASDSEVRLPKFSFTCTLDPDDRYAWMQVIARQPARVLAKGVADVMVYEGDLAQIEYRARSSRLSGATASSPNATAALLSSINQRRAGGQLAPLALAPAQRDANARLVGPLIDATIKGRDADADRIALGMIAGWDVDGTIRNGAMFMGMVAPATDVALWLDFAVERPFGRAAILDPEARRIAIAPTAPRSGMYWHARSPTTTNASCTTSSASDRSRTMRSERASSMRACRS